VEDHIKGEKLMPVTRMTGREILDGSIKKQDLNITDAGGAVATQIIGGDNIDLDWTGPPTDEGTGVVTVNVTGILFTEPAGAGIHPTVRKDSGHAIGTGCDYSGLLTGKSNTLIDDAHGSVIIGGSLNTVGGVYSSIVGGWYNELTTSSPYGSSFSSIGGGQMNSLYDSSLSVIGGGALNQLNNASSSVIAGGTDNAIISQDGSILGGRGNLVAGGNSSIAGGFYCSITDSTFSFIGGGRYNEIEPLPPAPTNSFGFIGSGYNNTVQGRYSTILNGDGCGITGDHTAILGGNNLNAGTGDFNLIGVAKDSAITGEYSAVLSGQGNAAAGYTSHAVIVGGNTNAIFGGMHPSIINGYDNLMTDASYATILNGSHNETESGNITILGGSYNYIDRDSWLSVLWGQDNVINPDCPHSFIHGDNIIANNFSQQTWTSGRFTDEWNAQVSEFMLRRCTGPGDSDNLPMYLDWAGDRRIGDGGSGSREVAVGDEFGTYFVECKVTAVFVYTGAPGGPIPQPKFACFYRDFLVTYDAIGWKIDGSTRFSPMSLTRQTGGDTELEAYFIVAAGGTMRLVVNHISKQQTAYWLGHIRLHHLSMRA